MEESLTLRWDPGPDCIEVDFSGKYPMFRIQAEAEKGGQNRLLPMTPEFAEHLEQVPESQRKGFVFRPLTSQGNLIKRTRRAVGVHVSDIGKVAGIITDRRTQKGVEVLSFAGAHDLRASFGFRWSRKLMPAELRELMRHEDIGTTMQYYVGINADEIAKKLWSEKSNILGNIGQKSGFSKGDEK